MKKLSALLIVCLMLLSLTACFGLLEDPAASSSDINSGKTDAENLSMFGTWESENGITKLLINDSEQIWYYTRSELVFRGNVELVEKTETENGYILKYKVYNGADEVVAYYFFDTDKNIILEKTEDGDLLDTYNYKGEFEDPSTFSAAHFEGYWEYNSGYIIQISDGQWFAYAEDGRMVLSGTVEYKDSAAYLKNPDGSSTGKLEIDEFGDMMDGDDVLKKLDEFPFGNSEGEQSGDVLKGLWIHSDTDDTIECDGKGGYKWKTEYGTDKGSYRIDGDEVTFHPEGEDGSSNARYDSSEGRLYVEGDAGSWFYKG